MVTPTVCDASSATTDQPKPLRSNVFIRGVDVIDLPTVSVNYDLTVEEMAALLPRSSSGINSEHYPHVHTGRKQGQLVEALALVRMYIDPFAGWSYQRLVDALAVLGFVPTELPTLTALAPFLEELAALKIDTHGAIQPYEHQRRINNILCLGSDSLWKNAPYKRVKTIATYIAVDERDQADWGIREANITGHWDTPENNWVITRRVTPYENPDTPYFAPPKRKRRSKRADT
jgi:hypothetical protein